MRRDPAINAAVRHRLENEAVDRRHARERRMIDRGYPLDLVDARERRGLIRDLVRQSRVEDLLREAGTHQRVIQMHEAARELTTDARTQGRQERHARVEALLADAAQKGRQVVGHLAHQLVVGVELARFREHQIAHELRSARACFPSCKAPTMVPTKGCISSD